MKQFSKQKSHLKGKSVHALKLGAYQSIDWRVSIQNANRSIENAIRLINVLPEVRPFNSQMAMDASSCYTSLVAHRLVNKFVTGSSTHNTQEVAFSSYIQYEEQLQDISDGFNIWGPTSSHLTLRKSKVQLDKWFKTFSVKLQSAFSTFSPGKTFLGNSQQVSTAAKLVLKENWTTHYGCIEETCELIYRNRILKAAAKLHFNKTTDVKALYTKYHNEIDVGYVVFRTRLLTEVLTVVDGACASSVPKNIETDRFINIEATFPMILQQIIAQEVRKVLKYRGNSLDPIRSSSPLVDRINYGFDAQCLHQFLIVNKSKATIDFSNASDSVLLKVVIDMFPKCVTELLIKTRSTYVQFPNELLEPIKLSSMGNGYTFEIMSALLYAIATTFDSAARVFGDDVIISNTKAASFIAACSLIGFNTNMKKTFINSPFRESCGAFYHDDVGFLESFEFKRVENEVDLLTFTNKLFIILNNKNTRILSLTLRKILDCLHRVLGSLIPASQKGPVPLTSKLLRANISLYCFDDDWRAKQTKRLVNRANYNFYATKCGGIYKLLQDTVQNKALVFIPFWSAEVDVITLRRLKHAPNLGFLLKTMTLRDINPTNRGRGKWVHLPAFVSPSGTIQLVRSLRGRCTDTLTQKPRHKGFINRG